MSDELRIAYRVTGRGMAELLCTHCGEPVLTLTGYGAEHFTRGLPGRIICEECDEQVKRGEVLPLRVLRSS